MSVTVVDDDIVQARPPRCSRCDAPIIGQGNIGGRCHNTEACKRRQKRRDEDADFASTPHPSAHYERAEDFNIGVYIDQD